MGIGRRLVALSLVAAACGGGTATTTATSAATTTTAAVQPAYVPPDCPADLTTTTAPGLPTTTTSSETDLSTEEQQALLLAIDAAVRDHYLYPEFNGTDWPGAVAAVEATVAAGLGIDAFYTAINDLIASLGDDHSHFETPVEVASSEALLAGAADFVGIGVLALPEVVDERVTLISMISVFPDSPADRAGLQPHDNIVAVAGVPLSEFSAVPGHGLRGPECSLVTLTVVTPGEAERLVALVRYRVSGGIPIEARLVPDPAGRRIGYVLVPTLLDTSVSDQVRAALEEWGELDGLIVDLRVNTGGSSLVLEPLLALFLSGTIGDFVSSAGSRSLEITADGVANSQTVPLVVLIGEDTESFAEVMAGVLDAEGRATLVGETTAGNVETLRGYDMPDGSMLWLAAERFAARAAPEADWERDGVVPDVAVPSEWDEFTFDTDPTLPVALATLGG